MVVSLLIIKAVHNQITFVVITGQNPFSLNFKNAAKETESKCLGDKKSQWNFGIGY